MEVRKADVAELLRTRSKALEHNLSNPANRAAHDNLVYNAQILDEAPGETFAQSYSLLDAEHARLKKKQNVCFAVGGVLFAGTAVALSLKAGSASNLELIGKLGGMMGSLGFIIAGGTTGDKISANRSTRSTLAYWEEKYSAPPAPQQSENLVLSNLSSAAEENRKDELVSVLKATQGYLGARSADPGMIAARHQVDNDLFILEKAPGETLAEMKTLARADTARANKQSPRYLAAGIAALAAAGAAKYFLGADFVLMGGALLGVGLMIKGGTLTDNEGRNNRLIGTVDRWELQLEGLKNIAGSEQEVRKLAAGPERGSLEVENGFLQVGGVRIPVRRQAATPQPRS
jgi:hypothetical protein